MKAFIILKNSDFTEGRGPMVFDTVCLTKDAVIKYLNSRPYGIYGWHPPKGKTFAEMVLGPSKNHGGWAGYEVREVEVFQ
jgi:hypothetical protein